MAGVGGSIEEVTLSGRRFAVAADADAQRKLGGWENEVQPNGDGTSRIIKTRVAPTFDGLVLHIADDRGDHEFLQDLSDGKDFIAMSVTLASGETWQGNAIPTGELQYSTQNATASLGLTGEGRFTKQ